MSGGTYGVSICPFFELQHAMRHSQERQSIYCGKQTNLFTSEAAVLIFNSGDPEK
jgi:hypothetical protein